MTSVLLFVAVICTYKNLRLNFVNSNYSVDEQTMWKRQVTSIEIVQNSELLNFYATIYYFRTICRRVHKIAKSDY